MQMRKQAVACALHREDGKPYVLEVELSPEVSFENGKATKATVNWGDVSAPMLIYPVLYAGTSLDNSRQRAGAPKSCAW